MPFEEQKQVRVSLQRLAEALETQQNLAFKLGLAGLSVEQLDYLLGMRQNLMGNSAGLGEMDVLEQCDREESLAAWLESRRVPDPWELTPLLTAAGVDRGLLLQLEEKVGLQTLPGVLAWLQSNLTTSELLQSLESAVLRDAEGK